MEELDWQILQMKGIESLPSWSREQAKMTVQPLSSVDASIFQSGTPPDLSPQECISNFADMQRPLAAAFRITLRGIIASKEEEKMSTNEVNLNQNVISNLWTIMASGFNALHCVQMLRKNYLRVAMR